MERRFFSGNTLEQAVMTAARHFGLEPDQVSYAQREKRHGFLKIRRRVVIEVDPDSPRRPVEAIVPSAAPQKAPPAAPEAPFVTPKTPPVARYAPATERPRREGRHASRVGWESASVEPVDLFETEEVPAESEEAAVLTEEDAVEAAVRDLARIAGLEVEWSAHKEDDTYKVEFSGRDAGALLEEGGRFLAAVEHLVPRLVRSRVGHGVACKADCEGFQAGHEERLQRLALRIAEEVRGLGEARVLEPMTPADRRVVHMALAEEHGVETESEGEGYYKRVKVMPVA